MISTVYFVAFLFTTINADILDLPISVPSDPNFWTTTNQVWDESNNKLCVYKENNCATNIGFFVKASGMDSKTISTPDFQYLLRFRMRMVCYGATITEGTECAPWAEDWSRYPLSPLEHRVSTTGICKTMYENNIPVGCSFVYPWGANETYSEWKTWHDCQLLETEPEKDACRGVAFTMATGWNYTVLYRMTDLVLQNGQDCEKYYVEKNVTSQAACESGQVDILENLASDKFFYGTAAKPLTAKAVFPPPSPPMPQSPPGEASPQSPLSPQNSAIAVLPSTIAMSSSNSYRIMPFIYLILFNIFLTQV